MRPSTKLLPLIRRDLILAIGPGENLARDLILVRLSNHLLEVLK